MFLPWLRQLPWCGDQTPASVLPPAEGRSSPTNTPVFPPVPSSSQVLRGSIYSFLLVRYSCPLSAGALHALLCLKGYSWCIHGERCIPRSPTPPPSCSSYVLHFISLISGKRKSVDEISRKLVLWGPTSTCQYVFSWAFKYFSVEIQL